MTFAILRDPEASPAQSVSPSPKLQKIFQSAARQSGLPASFISAISYLESWGNAKAESPAGPKGHHADCGGDGPHYGAEIVYATRYKIATEKKLVRKKKRKPVWINVRRKIPYTVLVRDERMYPEKAIPAAAQYLARLENRYGGRDWAVFAYHCGEGCAGEIRAIAQRSRVWETSRVSRRFSLGQLRVTIASYTRRFGITWTEIILRRISFVLAGLRSC